jgi:hypothetical protein
MKVLVTRKRVVDCNVKIRVKVDEGGVDLANLAMSMNPFDESADFGEVGDLVEVVRALAAELARARAS